MLSSWKVLLALLVAFMAVCPSQQEALLYRRQSRAGCPDFTTKLDFDATKFLGQWFETYRFDNAFETGAGCERAIYGAYNDTYVSVMNTAVLEDGALYIIEGSAHAISPDRPGFLIVSFPGRPDGILLILDTTYDRWAATYSCESAGLFTFEYAWLLSRTSVISESDKQEAFNAYTRNGVDVSKFQMVYHGDNCTYFPPYPNPLSEMNN